MAKLRKKHKEFIIKQLACYESPSSVRSEFKKIFNLEISLSQLSYYNPNSVQGNQELSDKWSMLYFETRRKFLEGAVDIPISHKQYRLRELQKNYEKLRDMGDISGANKVLEQAAKEMGGAYGDLQFLLKEKNEKSGEDLYKRIDSKIKEVSKGLN